MLSHEQQLLDSYYPVHGAYEGPSFAAFPMESKEFRYHGKNHAAGEQDQDPAFRG